ncbi:MAG: hypothetical protein H6831_05135 [Planctomycetes bacterium]|nr:hypothetical protein [Planctomycetota bacterium]
MMICMMCMPIGAVQADSDLHAHNLATAPIDNADLQAALDVAESIDSEATDALREAIGKNDGSGDVRVGTLWGFDDSGVQGASDKDTIVIRVGTSPEVVGVVLLHEWLHILHTDPGDEGDSRRADPCYTCTHSAMNHDSAGQLAALICTREYGPHQQAERQRDCRALSEIIEAAKLQMLEECLLGHCSWGYAGPPIPNECPACD